MSSQAAKLLREIQLKLPTRMELPIIEGLCKRAAEIKLKKTNLLSEAKPHEKSSNLPKLRGKFSVKVAMKKKKAK